MQERNIKEQLQQKKELGHDLMTIGRFLKGDLQKVGVCIHPVGNIGPYHTHDFFEINYVHSGNCINLVEEQYIEMSGGDFILMHPGTFHILYADNDCVVYNFLINKEWFVEKAKCILHKEGLVGKFLECAGREDFYKFLFIKKSQETTELRLIAEKVINAHKSCLNAKDLLIEAEILRLLATAVNISEVGKLSEGRGESSSKVITILTYLMKNYSTITLDNLSKKFYYSKTHICRLFIKYMGKTFNKTLMDIKLANALSLLKNTDLTIESIARKIGYDSNEYFQRMFKRKMGVSPGEYKRKLKSGQEQ